MHALEKDLTGIYHVGTGIETSINELWNILNGNNPNHITPQHTPALEVIQRSTLNPEKLQSTGWEISRNIGDRMDTIMI
jgi:hypothetical protein